MSNLESQQDTISIVRMYGSNNVRLFERYLVRKGYEVDLTGEHWKLKLPQYKNFTRMDTLDSRWTPQGIQDQIDKSYCRFGSKQAKMYLSPYMPIEYRTYYTPFLKTNKIYRLYIYYCYQLGILPKGTDFKPVSPYLKEDLRKLDQITKQVEYLAKNKIETVDELLSNRQTIQNELENLIFQRRQLQNKIRRAKPAEKEKLQKEKQGVTAQITTCRKRLKLNYNTEEQSVKIQENMDRIYANEERNRQLAQERKKEARSR